MDDLTAMNPGRLKRKKRGHSSSASVVNLPAAGTKTPSGALLGDNILNNTALADAVSDGPAPKNSLVDLVIDSKNTSSALTETADNSLQLKCETNDDTPSPLDMLAAKSSKYDGKISHPELNDAEDAPDDDNLAECFDNTRVSEDKSCAKLSGRKKFSKPAPKVQQTPQTDVTEIAEILAQNREFQQKCTDTLTRLQHTVTLNDRRHRLFTAISFAILIAVAIVGITVNVKLKNAAKNSDAKYRNEAYTAAVSNAKMLEAEFEKEKLGSAAAFEVYQRIEDGLFEESVEKFNELRNKITHPAELALLEQKIDEIRWKLAENAYHDGVMLYNGENFEQARDAFFKSLGHKENTSYAPRLNYYLAMSLYQLGDFEGARRYFAQLNPSELSTEMDANSRYYRAISAEKAGDKKEAYEQFDQFLKKYRYHRLADEAAKHRSKLESAKR